MKKYIRQCYFYAAWIFSKIVLILPYKFCVGLLADILGFLAYYVVADARNKARKHLTMCFPEKSKEEITKIIKTIFTYEAKNFFEVLSISKMSDDFVNSVVSMTELRNELDSQSNDWKRKKDCLF